MKKTGVKLLILMMLLVQVFAPVQAMASVEMALSKAGSDHCQLSTHGVEHGKASSSHKSCTTHCLASDQTSSSSSDNASGCDADASCATNCADCSHHNLVILNELLHMHQAVSHSPLQTSYDIYKYYPLLKLRPPRV